jgi:hypothetical protein
MMKRLAQLILMGVLLLVNISLAVAQESSRATAAATPQPVVRLGNFIEVGNDVWMHIIATSDARYKTVQNADFESRVRDQTISRNPSSTAQHDQEGDLFYAELRFGAEFKYQKNLHFYLLFEHQQVFDGNLIDDRANTSNPGGTDVFGRAAGTENPGFRVERFWTRYRFEGTPLTLFVGAELKQVSQAGIYGNDDPGAGVELAFGNLLLSAKAYVERESQRLGLQGDNDLIDYAFTAVYNARPHRFGMDVVWFRDRFQGADTAISGFPRPDLGWTGQKTDSVWINASWSGRFGPVRGLLQGNMLVGTARGSTVRGAGGTGLPATIPLERDYDLLAGGGIAYLEVDLGVVQPFIGAIYGTGDGDPTDRRLQGFQVQPVEDSTQITSTGFFDQLDTSSAFALRDYSCPARSQGLTGRPQGVPGDPYAVGSSILGAGGGTTQCSHNTSNVFNSRLGSTAHTGIVTTYSNPGTLVLPVGLKVFPLKGHNLAGWYVYRAMVDSSLLEIAFAPELAGRSRGIRKTQYHGVGGAWQWTLNPHFDIRLSGEIAIPGNGYKDIARLADCDPRTIGVQSCDGDDPAVKAEARFRARF